MIFKTDTDGVLECQVCIQHEQFNCLCRENLIIVVDFTLLLWHNTHR